MGKETSMLHVTPRARNGQRAKVAAKEVSHTRVARRTSLLEVPCRDKTAAARRLTPSLYAGSKEKARADKEKDRDTQQSRGREKVHVWERGRGKGKEQRSHERDKG